MPINSRSKGKRGELLVVHLLQHLWPNAHRSAAQGAGGHIAPDVDGTPFWIESKIGQRPNVISAMEQALRDRETGHAELFRRPPMVVTHRTAGRLDARVLITTRGEDLALVAQLYALALAALKEGTDGQ
jgi:hypothetical protein